VIDKPVWDIEAYSHAKIDMEVPVPSADGRVRIRVYHGGDWEAAVKRDDDSLSLMRRGSPESKTAGTLREVFGWLFGIVA